MAIWEFAPGLALEGNFHFLGHGALYQPLRLFASIWKRRAVSRSAGVSTPRGTVSTIMRSIRIPGLERPELFEFLPPLQRGGGKRHEALQRRAAIGIEADVMVARPLAPRSRSAGEVKRAQPPRADHGRADRLHHVRIGAFFLGMDFGGQGRDIDRGVGQRGEHAADIVGRDGRKIALQIDHDLGLARGRACTAPRRCGPSRTGGRRGS